MAKKMYDINVEMTIQEGYINLARDIVLTSVRDVRSARNRLLYAKRRLKENNFTARATRYGVILSPEEQKRYLKRTVDTCIREINDFQNFVFSKWFKVLTDTNPQILFDRIMSEDAEITLREHRCEMCRARDMRKKRHKSMFYEYE